MRLILLLLINCVLLFSAASHAVVEVTINKTMYTFTGNPRIVDVLQPIALKEQWYWPESKLFRSNTEKSQDLRSQIVKMLAKEGDTKQEYESLYQNIVSQIESWEVGDRVKIKIDFELARISAKHNPRMENGQYKIFLAKRPTTLYVFGAVKNAFELPYRNNTCVEDIISSMEFTAVAAKSYVYLISPQGKVDKSPIAYWNSQCTLPMPGSMIYVPLQESFFSHAQTMINTKITELAVNRITMQ